MSMLKSLILGLMVTLVFSMYEGNSAVVNLKANNFDQVNKGIWLVQFYAPWCGHCKNLAPEYEKAAAALKGIASIAAIDASNEKINVAIQGYPTIKFYVDGKSSDYNGQRNANGIVDFILNEYKKIASKRLGGGSSSGSSQGTQTGSADEKDVIILTDQNFQSNVYGDQMGWFVEFYAPWCGHCKNLVPQWAALATNLKGQIKVAKVDATENQQTASKFGVKGYPSIKFFPPGQKDESSAIDYEGGRSESAMAEWARQQTKDLKHFDHTELSSQKVYDELCKGRNLCIVSFLPNLLDSSEAEREHYLQTIKQVALKFRGKPFKFIWSQGGDQFDFEEKLGVSGIGYPSVVALFETKEVQSRLKRSFNEENLQNFLSDILKNKAKFAKLYPLPTLKTIEGAKPIYGQKKQGCDEHLCTGEHHHDQEFGQEL